MNRAIFFLFTVLLAVLLYCGSAISATGYQDIDAKGVKTLMEQEEALVVFPLSPMEFDHKHIKGSVNIIPKMMEYDLPVDKEKKIVFYCLGIKCVASWRAAEKAIKLGYKNVYAFREGLPAWEKAGYPIESTEKLPEAKIERISTTELSSLLYSDNMMLLDINLDEDAHKFHIEHANRKHIPLDELNVSLPQIPKGKKIVVMCLKGKRSATAAKYLISKGYEDVVIVEGGIQQWVLEGRPVKHEIASK
jgi:rhodanese-related sulfurtransferase